MRNVDKIEQAINIKYLKCIEDAASHLKRNHKHTYLKIINTHATINSCFLNHPIWRICSSKRWFAPENLRPHQFSNCIKLPCWKFTVFCTTPERQNDLENNVIYHSFAYTPRIITSCIMTLLAKFLSYYTPLYRTTNWA